MDKDLDTTIAEVVFGLNPSQINAWPWGVPPFSTERRWSADVLGRMLAHPQRARFEEELESAARKWGWGDSPDQAGPATLALVLTPDEICAAAIRAVRGCGSEAPT